MPVEAPSTSSCPPLPQPSSRRRPGPVQAPISLRCQNEQDHRSSLSLIFGQAPAAAGVTESGVSIVIAETQPTHRCHPRAWPEDPRFRELDWSEISAAAAKTRAVTERCEMGPRAKPEDDNGGAVPTALPSHSVMAACVFGPGGLVIKANKESGKPVPLPSAPRILAAPVVKAVRSRRCTPDYRACRALADRVGRRVLPNPRRREPQKPARQTTGRDYQKTSPLPWTRAERGSRP